MGTPFLTQTKMASGLSQIEGGGAWTAVHAASLERQLDEFVQKSATIKKIIVQVRNVVEFDTFGIWLLERLRRDLQAKGTKVEIRGLGEHDRSLFGDMANFNRASFNRASFNRTSGRQAGTDAPNKTSPQQKTRSLLEKIGHSVTGMWLDILAFANLFGALVVATGRVIRHPRSFRLTAAVHQLDRVGLQAVPIILLITFLIGAIIAQQGIFHFRKFGAELYVVDMVSILVMREIGVLLVAIMVAGRSGSSFTAELGSMKMREEVDALETMGFNPVDILILPRVLVLIVAVPLLTFLGSMAALYGGGLVAWLYAGMSPDLFIERLRDAISLDHFKVGMIKAPFMGAIIGIIACTEGLRVRGSAASLGQQTTRAVVKSIFMVIVLDGLFAIFFASIGI